MAELFLECYSEEIPASYQRPAAEQLRDSMMRYCTDTFAKDAAAVKAVAYVTPKRLVLHITGIPAATAARTEEERGPREGAPDKALEGFAKARGLTVDQLTLKETPKGKFYFCEITTEATPTGQLLADATVSALAGLHWPKSMQWAAHSMKWPRPLHNICAVFDGRLLPLMFGHITSTAHTYTGMPHKQQTVAVTSFTDYKKIMDDAGIMLCRDARIAYITEQAQACAETLGFQPLPSPRLIEEIAGLVERPVPLTGTFNADFLSLPKEVLFSVMKGHQKYIPLIHGNGDAAPAFFFMGEGVSDAVRSQVVRGNERVLAARLQDALFFEQQDSAVALEALQPKLKNITFHADLGTVYDKAERLASLAKLTAMWVQGANLVHVERAAALCKCDLASLMVTEFPELQGFIGGKYATRDSEDKEVADAVLEHYLPTGPNTRCPTAPVSVALALADKIDTLVGLFAAGERATGSRDPYGLRRNALGVIRLITENNLRVPLKLLLEKAIARYPAALFKEDRKGLKRVIPLAGGTKEKKITLVDDMLEFFRERLRYLLKNQGVHPEMIEAALFDKDEHDIVRILLKLKALKHFLKEDDSAEALITVYKRASGIVAKQEKNGDTRYGTSPVNEQLFTQDEEKQLYQRMIQLKDGVKKHVEQEAFAAVFRDYAAALPDIERFFDGVTVNDDDKERRENRLHLLGHVRDLMLSVADFSQLPSLQDMLAENDTSAQGNNIAS